MFGFWQILILVVILFVIFGYKKLPALGRSAGEGVNKLKGSVDEMVGDHKVDPSTLGKSAGKGVREFREFKDAFSGPAHPPVERSHPVAEKSQAPPESAPRPAEPRAASEEPEPVDGELVNGSRSSSQ